MCLGGVGGAAEGPQVVAGAKRGVGLPFGECVETAWDAGVVIGTVDDGEAERSCGEVAFPAGEFSEFGVVGP